MLRWIIFLEALIIGFHYPPSGALW